MFPKNAWYVACTPDEIEGKPLGRQICGEKIVFYRGAGARWPRRGFLPAPRRAAVAGLRARRQPGVRLPRPEMGCDGKVVSMPGQRVRGFPCIRSYPVEERYGFIWVWTGDKEKADPAPSIT
jgi:vanillate O-demethylase monooxygenase subunit